MATYKALYPVLVRGCDRDGPDLPNQARDVHCDGGVDAAARLERSF